MTRALVITNIAIIALCVLIADSVSAHPAWGIVVDRNKQIYFSDIETIWKIAAREHRQVLLSSFGGMAFGNGWRVVFHGQFQCS